MCVSGTSSPNWLDESATDDQCTPSLERCRSMIWHAVASENYTDTHVMLRAEWMK